MGDSIVTDAPKRTAKLWGGALRPPAPRRKDTGELIIEDAKPAAPSTGPVARAEAVRVVMPALQLPDLTVEPDADVIAGELDADLEPLPELPQSRWRIALVVAIVVIATTWFLLAL